ncbi:hypothetical protein HanPI659440_Chr10g0400361 [Helianthus annuus]|nr:hypothetical protein HanPI659440_Chr10g0400361 [Helianthus annuus]
MFMDLGVFDDSRLLQLGRCYNGVIFKPSGDSDIAQGTVAMEIHGDRKLLSHIGSPAATLSDQTQKP